MSLIGQWLVSAKQATQTKNPIKESKPGTHTRNPKHEPSVCTFPFVLLHIPLLLTCGLPRSPLQQAWQKAAVHSGRPARCGCLPAAARHTVEWWPAALVDQMSDWPARPNLRRRLAHPPNISLGRSPRPATITLLKHGRRVCLMQQMCQ